MNEHPSARQLTEYCRREIPPAEFLAIHRHLLSCPACAESYDLVSPTAGDYAALQGALLPDAAEEPFHLTEQGALDYLNGQADAADRELANAHLEDCSMCAAAVSSLRQSLKARAGYARPAPLSRSAALGANYLSRLLVGAGRHRLTAVASSIAVVGLAFSLLFLRGGHRTNEPLAPLPSTNVPTPPPPSGPGPSTASGQEGGKVAYDSYTEPTPERPAERKPVGRTPAPSVVLNDGGGVVTLTTEGQLTGLPAMPEDLRRAVASALITGRVKTPRSLAALKGSHSIMLGEANEGVPFPLLGPVGIMTAERRPVLSWSPLPGASSYTVTVTDESHDEVVTSGPLTGSEWRVPVALATGQTYSWQVAALKGGEEVVSPILPAPAAKFRVIDAAQEKRLRRAKRRYPGYHLVLGVLYARAGLLDEASREFQALSRANPDSAVPPMLLRNIR